MIAWYVYIVECVDNSLYAGITTDVAERVVAHNSAKAGARYTRSRRPVVLRYVSEWPDRAAAAREEWRIKQLTREQKLSLCRVYTEAKARQNAR